MSEDRALKIATGFIESQESFEPDAYPDPLHGWAVPTIGYGTTTYPGGGKVKRGDTCNYAQARRWMQHHIEAHVMPPLHSIPTWHAMNEYQQAALISFGYNLGAYFFGARQRESITRLCTRQEYWGNVEFVITTFVKYRNPGSSAENGLRLRRLLEANMFLTIER